MSISIALHIIGIVMWTGSLLIASRIQAIGIKSSADYSHLWIKKIFWGWSVPGSIITILTGLYQLGHNGFGYYFSQHWFHGKMLFIFILILLTVLQFTSLNKQHVTVQVSMLIHGLTGLSLILIVFLTILGR